LIGSSDKHHLITSIWKAEGLRATGRAGARLEIQTTNVWETAPIHSIEEVLAVMGWHEDLVNVCGCVGSGLGGPAGQEALG
jgi:hypothetical protein